MIVTSVISEIINLVKSLVEQDALGQRCSNHLLTITVNIKLWAVIAYYNDGINTDGYCFKDSVVIDGIDDGVLPALEEYA